jgi:hypothetical protein
MPWAALALWLAIPAQGQVGGQAPVAGRDAVEAVRAAMSLRAATIVRLDIDREPAPLIRVSVPIDGVNRTLDLTPHSVRAPGYRLIEARADGTYVDVKPGPDTTYRGGVLELPGSVAAGGLVEGGLYAEIVLADGRQFWLEPVPRGLGARAGEHVIYAGSDVVPTGARCQTDDAPAPVDGNGGGGGGLRGTTLYHAEMGCDADYEYYVRYGSVGAVQARISAVINTMNLQYERDVDITHDISVILVRSGGSNPYPSAGGATLLGDFRAWWNANMQGTPHDVALLFTGKDVDHCSCAAGKAYGGTVCTDWGYGWVQADMGGTFSFACDDAAHEIGHTWNACHCACVNPPYTMNPNITSANRFGGPPSDCSTGWNSTTEIFVFRGTRTCLDTSYSGGIVRNDFACSAVPISVGTWGFNTYNTNTDGPPASCRPGTRDIWYKYSVPCSGTTTVTTCGSDFDTVLIAYSGGGCTDIASREIACNDDDAGACPGQSGLLSRISFPATGGQEYLIRVAGYNNATGAGLLNITHSAACGVANDECYSARAIVRGRNYAFSTVGATTTPSRTETLCANAGDSNVANDIWFSYQVPPGCGGQTIQVSLCGSSFDTKLAAYSYCPFGPNQAIACNDDNGPACGGLQSSLNIPVGSAGTIYYFRVGGFNGAVGSGVIRVDHLGGGCPFPSNDDCFSAIPVSYGSPAATGSTVGATRDGRQFCSAFAESPTTPDVWYSFAAPCNQPVHVDLCGSSFDTVLSIHSLCPFGNFTFQITCNDDSIVCQGASSVDYSATGGDTYYIRVSGFQDAAGSFQLNLRVANDDCAGAIAVSDGSTPICNVGANNGYPTWASSRDVWYRYTATCTGRVRAEVCMPGVLASIAAYSESGCPYPIGLYELAVGPAVTCSGQAGSAMEFNVTAGTSYLIRVGGTTGSGAGGTGTLTITRLRPADCDGNGVYQPADVACFVSLWVASLGNGSLAADFDGNGRVEPADIAAFVNAWFAALNAGGC